MPEQMRKQPKVCSLISDEILLMRWLIIVFAGRMCNKFPKSGRVSWSIACLITDACLNADEGVASSIPV